MKGYFFLLPLGILLLTVGYAGWRIWHILPLAHVWRWAAVGIMLCCIALFFAGFTPTCDRLPFGLSVFVYQTGISSFFILLYLLMTFLVLDIGRLVRLVPSHWVLNSTAGSLGVAGLMLGLFTYGYFNYLHKVRVPLTLTTEKPLEKPLKIVMLSDLHIGYHNRAEELRRWVKLINREQPDLVLIGGDLIDKSLRAIEEQDIEPILQAIEAPVYACPGNHEYFDNPPEMLKFYERSGIQLLRDSVVSVKGIQLIGRDDRMRRHRAPLGQLMQKADTTQYLILLDHQPYHLEEAQRAGIDFQFSGHTHHGQLWPASWIENYMYEKAHGTLTKGNTHYYVSSGIGIWGAKFRIGTQSEYVVATLSGGQHSDMVGNQQ